MAAVSVKRSLAWISFKQTVCWYYKAYWSFQQFLRLPRSVNTVLGFSVVTRLNIYIYLVTWQHELPAIVNHLLSRDWVQISHVTTLKTVLAHEDCFCETAKLFNTLNHKRRWDELFIWLLKSRMGIYGFDSLLPRHFLSQFFVPLYFPLLFCFLVTKKMPLNALITRIVETCSYHFLPRWSGAPGRKVPRNVRHGREKMVTGLSCSKHG